MDKQGKRIHINGIVQGVGFRPFIFGLADRLSLTGWVRNTSAGVDIEVDGRSPDLDSFIQAIRTEAPPLAQIDDVTVESIPANGFARFEIVHSEAVSGAFQPISPDVTVCEDCLHEMMNPQDRRYRYPFINCTNCGPRFTIIQDIPYDRPLTTMAPFPMCADCRAEYENPRDRRFHAQPVACPVCGPHVWLEEPVAVSREPLAVNRQRQTDDALRMTHYKDDAIQATRRLLANGRILAVKGLGGFHLACDATQATAVAELRQRKLRREKPFAVMMPDLETVRAHCRVSDAEAELLTSRARPIVILERLPASTIAREVAPGQNQIGVMLPYTPLHVLLFAGKQATENGKRKTENELTALVMTSGNLSEEPIAYRNDEARTRLAPLADAFLLHNRDIHVRCDDSVMQSVDFRLTIDDSQPNRQSSIVNRQSSLPIRRSRGYTPFPVKLPWTSPPLLAAGAELKNTFCLANGRYAFLSHHIGDMENVETLTSFEEGVAHFEKLFRVQPQLIAYDLHPNYLATRYALERAAQDGIPAIGVQHHHAHIAACMAEHGLPDAPVIGVSLDGTGYGDDGTIWGGEILLADYRGYERPFHLRPVPLPGGDKAVKEPWRMALAWLDAVGIDWGEALPSVQHARALETPLPVLDALRHQLTTGLNAPQTSSMGRLFDAVAALMGVRQTVNYEAQAAIELEALVDGTETAVYPTELHHGWLDPAPLLHALVNDLQAGVPVPQMAARFHNGVATAVVQVAQTIRQIHGLRTVVLSGGVWQNVTLLSKTIPQLKAADFDVYWHQQVPPNDGGLALGQASVAVRQQVS